MICQEQLWVTTALADLRGPPGTPPPIQILSFSCSCRPKKNRLPLPLWELAPPPPRKILDPPLDRATVKETKEYMICFMSLKSLLIVLFVYCFSDKSFWIQGMTVEHKTDGDFFVLGRSLPAASATVLLVSHSLALFIVLGSKNYYFLRLNG